MCEANVYLMRNGNEEIIMESVDILRPEQDGIYLLNIFGDQLKIKARIKEVHLVNHRILLVED